MQVCAPCVVLALKITGRARHAGGGKNVLEGSAQVRQFLGTDQLLKRLEQFAFFPPDVGRQSRREITHRLRVHRQGGRGAQANVVAPEVIYKLSQSGEALGHRKEHVLLGIEMKADLLVEEAGYLRAYRGKLVVVGARNPDAQRQRVLVLMRKRDEGWIAEHASSYCASRRFTKRRPANDNNCFAQRPDSGWWAGVIDYEEERGPTHARDW